jgi:hypothetical protein
MDMPNLPRHVLERVERRWAAVLARQAALRPVRRPRGMQQPSPDGPRQTPERAPAQPISKRQDWNGLF